MPDQFVGRDAGAIMAPVDIIRRRRLATLVPSGTSVAAAVLVANAFLLRPGALGQSYVPVGMALGVVIVGLHLLLQKGSAVGRGAGRNVLFVAASFLAYWMYEVSIALARGDSNEEQMTREFIACVVPVISYGVFLSHTHANRKFFATLAVVVAMLGWSSVVTTALSAPFGMDRLYITSIPIKGYDQNVGEAATGAIYFPFSMQYTSYQARGFTLIRYCNFFREAGIYQAISLFLLAYEQFTRRSRFVTGGLLFGAILSFSTIGLFLLPATIGMIFIVRHGARPGRILMFALASSICAIGMAFATGVGLFNKMETHGSSVSDRSNAMRKGISSLGTDPLGAGMFSSGQHNDGICLIASVSSIGLVGGLLQALILSGWRPGATSAFAGLSVCFPLFATALFSQPIVGDGMTYLLAMVALPPIVRPATTVRGTEIDSESGCQV